MWAVGCQARTLVSTGWLKNYKLPSCKKKVNSASLGIYLWTLLFTWASLVRGCVSTSSERSRCTGWAPGMLQTATPPNHLLCTVTCVQASPELSNQICRQGRRIRAWMSHTWIRLRWAAFRSSPFPPTNYQTEGSGARLAADRHGDSSLSAFWKPSHRSKWSRKEYQDCFLENLDGILPFLLPCDAGEVYLDSSAESNSEHNKRPSDECTLSGWLYLKNSTCYERRTWFDWK